MQVKENGKIFREVRRVNSDVRRGVLKYDIVIIWKTVEMEHTLSLWLYMEATVDSSQLRL